MLFNVAALAITGGELFWDNRNNQQQQRITNLQLEASDFILRGNELSTTIAEATMNWDNNLQLKAFKESLKAVLQVLLSQQPQWKQPVAPLTVILS